MCGGICNSLSASVRVSRKSDSGLWLEVEGFPERRHQVGGMSLEIGRGRVEVTVTEQVLNRAQVGLLIEQELCEMVSEGVW